MVYFIPALKGEAFGKKNVSSISLIAFSSGIRINFFLSLSKTFALRSLPS
ncbi:hypothetical protein [Thermococcus sp.]